MVILVFIAVCLFIIAYKLIQKYIEKLNECYPQINVAYLCDNQLTTYHYPLYSQFSKKYIRQKFLLNKIYKDKESIHIRSNKFTFERCKLTFIPGLIRCKLDLDEAFTVCNDDYWKLLKFIFTDMNELNFQPCHLSCDRVKIKYFSLINYEKLKIIPSMDNFQINCLLEIKQMKNEYLYKRTINIYDLLMRNEYVSIKSNKSLSTYKIYNSLIKKLIYLAQERYNLCKLLYDSMYIKTNKRCIYLGYCIVDTICKNLSFADLDNLNLVYENYKK